MDVMLKILGLMLNCFNRKAKITEQIFKKQIEIYFNLIIKFPSWEQNST